MVAMKFLGIIIAFYVFVFRETFGQSFYPARYGKRVGEGFREEVQPEGRKFGRSDDQSPITDRKIRFFFSGGRYGKRACSGGKCSEGPKEMFSWRYERPHVQSDKISMPIRKNQFMTGSRFGKRLIAHKLETDKVSDSTSVGLTKCVLASFKGLYRCFAISNLIGARTKGNKASHSKYINGGIL